jgi:2-keto-4-pentenoate hydratase
VRPLSGSGSRTGGLHAELAAVKASLVVDGAEKSTGEGAANPLGSPLASLAWCVNHLAMARGKTLRAGMLVIAGAYCKTRDCQAGSVIEAKFGGLGSVTTTMAE